MNDDQFTELFKYVEAFFDDMSKRFDQLATKDSIESLVTSSDTFIGVQRVNR